MSRHLPAGKHISENSSLIIFHAVRAGEEMVITGRCSDASADCEHWMRDGQCQLNHAFMREECPLSCDLCSNGRPAPCVDDERCAGWAKEEHCVRNRRFMCATPLVRGGCALALTPRLVTV